MINNGAIIIRYGHTIFVKKEGNNNKNTTTESHLPVLAQRLIAEIHRSEKLFSSDKTGDDIPPTPTPIKIKNKYFEADLNCILVDDNIVDVSSSTNNSNNDNNNKNEPQSSLGALDVIASLKCGRIPYGIVQVVDLAQLSTQMLLSDSECSSSSKQPLEKFDAPLFNLCLVVASSSATSASSSPSSPAVSQLEPGHQQLYQKWKETCVELGIECVPWIISSSSSNAQKEEDISKPQPPPLGIEKRGLLQSMKEGELTGSSRVLEVLNQSLWCTFDPMLAMKVKERTMLKQTNNSNSEKMSLFEGIYHDNLIGLISSSRYTCEFAKQVLEKVPGVMESKLVIKNATQEDTNENEKDEHLFVGSADGQNFSLNFSSPEKSASSSSSSSADVNIYFSPLQMMISNNNNNLHPLGASELEKMISIPSCNVICFHILKSDIENSSSSVSQYLHSIAKLLTLLNKRVGEENFTNRIKLASAENGKEELSCFVLIDENTNSEYSEEERQNQQYAICDLMQLGCEVVFVSREKDDGKLWDKEEGAIGLNRISEIFSCVAASSWRSKKAAKVESKKKRREQSPLEKNSVVIVVPSSSSSSTKLEKDLASFIAKSFSDDNDETLTSSHTKKTDWLNNEISLSISSSLGSNKTKIKTVSVYPMDLSTKYYVANVDVIVVETIEVELVKTVLEVSDAQVLLIYSKENENETTMKNLLEQVCFVKEDDDDEQEENEKEKNSGDETSDENEPFRFALGPHSNKIALVVSSSTSSNPSSSLVEYCEENFIEIIGGNNSGDDEQSSVSSSSSSLTQKVFDSLSCVEWKNIMKKENTTTTTSNGGLPKNIHEHTQGYYDNDAKVVSSSKQQAHSSSTSSAIDAAMKSLLNTSSLNSTPPQAKMSAEQTKQNKEDTKPPAIIFTCAIPPRTHRYDRILKKTVLIAECDDGGKKNGNNDNENENSHSDVEDDDDDNDMSDLLQQMREVRDSKRLSREERQKRAEELSQQFAKRLHKDDDLADALVKNLM